MTKTKTPSIISQIVDRLYSDGALNISQMCETIKYTYKSVYTKALELQKLGLVGRDANGMWSLQEGVSPRTLITGELEEPGAARVTEEETEPGAEVTPAARKAAPLVRSSGVPLDQRGMFIEELKNIGVIPKEAIPTVANIFFSGDIESLHWLEKVLKRDAAGFISHHQRRLIISWWSNTRGLPYDEEDFFPDVDTEGKSKKVEARPAKPLDLGQGWKVDKNKHGDWAALPGGAMTYQEAVDASERRALIDSYSQGAGEAEGEAATEGDQAAPARKGKPGAQSFVEVMMIKLMDNVLDGGKGKTSEESETVHRLTERIENMERERQEERFERMEGMIANIASRDPWEEYDRIQSMKDRLGVGTSAVTDQSPAVQLIKDTTDKMDKNVARLVGVIERTALRSEEFTPERTRSTQERESKAGELLGEVESRERSKTLRQETFGI